MEWERASRLVSPYGASSPNLGWLFFIGPTMPVLKRRSPTSKICLQSNGGMSSTLTSTPCSTLLRALSLLCLGVLALLTTLPLYVWISEFTGVQWLTFNCSASCRIPSLATLRWAPVKFRAVEQNDWHCLPQLLDYTATKGAIVGFSRALSNQIVGEKGIRVNCVCPGPSELHLCICEPIELYADRA